MSQSALADSGEIKPTHPLNAKLEALQDSVSSRFPFASFKFAKTGGGNHILYIEYEDHCLRIEKTIRGLRFYRHRRQGKS